MTSAGGVRRNSSAGFLSDALRAVMQQFAKVRDAPALSPQGGTVCGWLAETPMVGQPLSRADSSPRRSSTTMVASSR